MSGSGRRRRELSLWPLALVLLVGALLVGGVILAASLIGGASDRTSAQAAPASTNLSDFAALLRRGLGASGFKITFHQTSTGTIASPGVTFTYALDRRGRMAYALNDTLNILDGDRNVICFRVSIKPSCQPVVGAEFATYERSALADFLELASDQVADWRTGGYPIAQSNVRIAGRSAECMTANEPHARSSVCADIETGLPLKMDDIGRDFEGQTVATNIAESSPSDFSVPTRRGQHWTGSG